MTLLDGSIAHPYSDLSLLFQGTRVQPGQTIYLRGGVYPLIPPIQISGEPQLPITICNYPGETVIFRPDTGTSVRALDIDNCHDLILDGIKGDAINLGSDCIKITDCDNISLLNIEAMNATNQGILIGGDSSSGLLLQDVITHDNGSTDLHHGVYAHISGQLTLRRVEAYGHAGHGIHIYSGLDSGETLIDVCYTHNNAIGIGFYYGTGHVRNSICTDTVGVITGYSVIQVDIDFNTLLASARDLDIRELMLAGATVRLRNNVCAGSPESLVVNPALNADGATIAADHNLLLHETLFAGGEDHTGYSETGTVLAAFSPTDGEHRPTAGNPAIGAGIAVVGVTTDYSGALRANPPTIGAWE